MVSDGDALRGTVTVFDGTGAIGLPDGGEPVVVAVLTTLPADTSPAVVTRDPVQVADAPGARDVAVQVTPVVLGSVTVTAVRVTLPVFVTVNE